MKETLRDKKSYVPELMDQSYEFDGLERFAVVGDVHANNITPKSRIDDYPQTIIEKLDILREHLKVRGVSLCVFLGDIFHKPKQPSEYEYRIISAFQRFAEDGITCCAITGNHDIINERLDSISRTSLGILYLTGVLKPFTKITIHPKSGGRDTVIWGVHYPNDIPDLVMSKDYQVVAAHKFYEYSLDSESLEKEDVESNGYNMLLLGHDHMPYDLVEVPTNHGLVRIVRPGSLSRGTAHSYNTKRLVNVDIVNIDGQVSVIRDVLNVKSPNEVFSSSVTDKVTGGDLDDVLQKQLSELVTRLYESDESELTVYEILDKSEIEPEVKMRIESYLYDAGIFRRKRVVVGSADPVGGQSN